MNADQLRAARAILGWAAKTRRMRWQEYNALMKDVCAKEWRLIACNGKECFDTFAMAQWVCDRRKWEHKAREAYHCEHCGKYHIARFHPRSKTIRLRLKEKREAAYG